MECPSINARQPNCTYHCTYCSLCHDLKLENIIYYISKISFFKLIKFHVFIIKTSSISTSWLVVVVGSPRTLIQTINLLRAFISTYERRLYSIVLHTYCIMIPLESCLSMKRENRPLVADQLVELEKYPIQISRLR